MVPSEATRLSVNPADVFMGRLTVGGLRPEDFFAALLYCAFMKEGGREREREKQPEPNGIW